MLTLLLTLLLGGGQARPAPPAKAASAPVTAPAIATLPADAEVKALRAKYVGKEVWVYGGGRFHCAGKYEGAGLESLFDQPVKILDIERLSGTFPVLEVKQSGVMPARPVKNPLRLRLRLSEHFQVTSWRGYVRPRLSDCREVTETYLNVADLEKNFSLTPPDAAIKQTFAAYLKNGPRSTPGFIGLTHRQVLWLRGIPESPVGDLGTLLGAPVWLWNGLPGRGDLVLHFQNDRVVQVEVPSMGP